jgi:hypothetical protein
LIIGIFDPLIWGAGGESPQRFSISLLAL